MFLEQWKHTAFGSDFGMDVLKFLESFPGQRITLEDIYARCDLQAYIATPELLRHRTDNNVTFNLPDMGEMPITVHYEDMVIALGAVAAECAAIGSADLRQAFGSKLLVFDASGEDLQTLLSALAEIHQTPDRFVLFEMCGDQERQETLADVKSILDQLSAAISQR